MPYDTLQEFLQVLESQGELRRITAPVDPVLEIALDGKLIVGCIFSGPLKPPWRYSIKGQQDGRIGPTYTRGLTRNCLLRRCVVPGDPLRMQPCGGL